MNHSLKALIGSALLISIVSAPVALSQTAGAETLPPDPETTVTETVTETITDTVTVPGPTITAPPLPAATITLPGETVTVRVPQETVTVPAPTVTETPTIPVETETLTPPTETVTTRPEPAPTVTRPAETVTVRPEPSRPTVTVSGPPGPTETVTVTPSQESTEDATLVPEPQQTDTEEDPRTIEKVVTQVIKYTVATLIVALLGILAMFFGYGLGRKDGERIALGFYRSLITAVKRQY